MSTPDFLKTTEDSIEASELSRLQHLVKEYQDREAMVKDLEEELKHAKEAFNVIAQQEIPNILNQYGIGDIRLASGDKISVKQELSVSVKADKLLEFYKFLEDRGDTDIIKLMFQFRRMPEEKMQDLFTFLNEYGYDYEYEKGVHPQTLKKYFKELLGIGQDDQEEGIRLKRYLKPSDVNSFATFFVYYTTKIK